MKILILDDSQEKIGKLLTVFLSEGISNDKVETATCVFQAKQLLREQHFDLFVIDILIPNRNGEPAKIENSLEMLRELHSRSSFNKPKRIVGFTAYDEGLARATNDFTGNLWALVRYDPTSSDWEEQFRNVAKYLLQSSTQTLLPSYEVELLVLTALLQEQEAVLALPWNWQPAEPIDDHTFIRRGRIGCAGQEQRVVAVCAARMGSVCAAVLTTKMIERFRPRMVALCGICAGIRGSTELGDLVLGSPVWDWQAGKMLPKKSGSVLEPAPHQIPLCKAIEARFNLFRSEVGLLAQIKQNWPASSPKGNPSIHIGPIASGDSVVADQGVVDQIRGQHRKVIGIEMEAYGVFAAVEQASHPRPVVFVLKAVCDFADEQKSDDWQKYCCYISAWVTKEFIERHMAAIFESI